MMNQLVLPIALWGTPPPHSVTSILIIMNRSVLVTGSNSGQICVWSIESDKPSKEGGLTPLILCLGHNSPINALVECNFEGTDAFISISSDGVMHAWRAQDGKCLKGGQFTAFYPLQFACIPGDKRRIALAGCHCDIELIDAWSLKPMSTLRGHQDWVTALATCVCDNKEPILLSASRDGLVHFWTMKFGEHYPIRTVCIDEGPVPDISPLSLALSPDLKSFVVVTPREWLLYTTQNSHFICAVACPEGAEWLSAKYLDNETLLAWTSQAIAAAYQLTIPSTAETLSMAPSISTILANEVFDGGSPPSTPRGRSNTTTSKNPLKVSSNLDNTNLELENTTDTASNTNTNINIKSNINTKESIFATISPASPHYQGSPKISFPMLLYTINEFPPDNYSSLSSSSSSSFASSSIALSHSSSFSSLLNVRSSPPTYLPPLSPKTSPDFNNNPFPSPRATLSSSSSSSSFSSSFSSFFDPNMHRYESSFSQFAACSNNFFALGDANGQVGLWNVKRENVTHWCSGKISDGWKGINTPLGKAVTATLVLEDSFVLIRGHENGQLSCSTLPTDAFPKFYKAHLARVNCLLCSPVMPNSFSTKFSSIAKRLLITGSDDFTIKVWELPTFELIHTFTHHTGPITWLFLPPYNPRHPASNYWGSTFFAVSEDKCVGQYSLDGMKCLHLFGVHPALVSSVKCKWEQDYLVVESVDGGVALWEIATGELEGIVYGQMAREISENSDTIWTSYNHPRGSPKVTLSQTESHFSNYGSFANFANFSYPSSPKKDGSFSPSVSGKKDGNFGVSVRAAYIPTLLHRSPIQLLYLDVKHIAREIRSYLPNQDSSIFTPSERPTSLNLNASPKNINSNYSNSNPNSNLNSSHDSSKRPHLAHSFEGVNPRRQSLQAPALATVSSLVNLPSYQVFSYLIPWGIDKQWDSIWKKDLNLRPPMPNFTFGLNGDCGNLSIMLPAASEAGKWRLSTELTSTITLSAVTLSKVLLNLTDSKNSCGQILSYYCGLFPEMMASLSTSPSLSPSLSLSFSEPLLPMLAIHTIDTMEEVVSASHSILFSALDKFTNEARHELTHNLCEQMKATNEVTERGLMAIVMATIGAYRPDALDDVDARTIAIELLKILYKPNTGAFTQGAVELIGKGYATWRQYIKDPSRLIRALFTLSHQSDSLGQVSHLSLLLVGTQDPKTFIICLAQEIHRDYSHPHSHSIPNHSSSAVMVLGALVRKDSLSVLSQLPRLVETIVKSLDPHSPSLRDVCLKASTAVLHVMVTKYPMVSFHQETQRMAVGTGDNAIVIYDLKTATRWHVLEGHKNTISAVAFSENGKALASYSVVECAVRIWQASSSFLGILSGAQLQCVKVFGVSKAAKPIPLQMQLQSVKVQWLSPSIVTLYRGWEDPVTFNVDPV